MTLIPFEPEFVSGLFSGDEISEYNEDFRDRHATAAVFEKAQTFQTEFLATRLNKEDLVQAWNGAQEFIGILDKQASEEGLMGEMATLKGTGIDLPKFETELSAAVSLISLSDSSTIDEKSLDKYYSADEVKGLFSGFTLRFIGVGDDVFIPKLACQVATSVVDTPNAHVNLYATGIIGQTRLSFDADEKKDRIAPLLEKLFILCGEQAKSLNLINTALASNEKYDASIIRHVAYHSEKMLNFTGEDNKTLAEDELIDLLTHYIGVGDSVFIKTPAFSLSAKDTTTGAEYYEDNDLYSLQGRTSGLIFMYHPIIKDGVVTFRDMRKLHLVLEHDGRNIYTPLTQVQEFGKV